MGKVEMSLLQLKSFEFFSAAIKSPATREPYQRKLLGLNKSQHIDIKRGVSRTVRRSGAIKMKGI
jgi:hypothetical protein